MRRLFLFIYILIFSLYSFSAVLTRPQAPSFDESFMIATDIEDAVIGWYLLDKDGEKTITPPDELLPDNTKKLKDNLFLTDMNKKKNFSIIDFKGFPKEINARHLIYSIRNKNGKNEDGVVSLTPYKMHGQRYALKGTINYIPVEITEKIYLFTKEDDPINSNIKIGCMIDDIDDRSITPKKIGISIVDKNGDFIDLKNIKTEKDRISEDGSALIRDFKDKKISVDCMNDNEEFSIEAYTIDLGILRSLDKRPAMIVFRIIYSNDTRTEMIGYFLDSGNFDPDSKKIEMDRLSRMKGLN